MVCLKWYKSLCCLGAKVEEEPLVKVVLVLRFPIQEPNRSFAALLLGSAVTHTQQLLFGVHDGNMQKFKGSARKNTPQ